jgi:hypothetical protein
MRRSFSRRTFLMTGSALLATKPAIGGQSTAGSGSTGSNDPSTAISPVFPTQDPALVREVVGVSHGNVKRVKELVDRRPTLALATWDWGFGDWETALGAASHVGNREIAEYLIAHGARPTIFSAAMLGQLEVVKAFVAASPGVQRIHGPHSITLLSHAKAGGEPAKAVVAYLEQLGDADRKIESMPLTDAEAAALVGTFAYGPAPTDRITIDVANGQLGFLRANATRRGLAQRAPREFSPVGAPNVRIKLAVEGGRAMTLTVHDPDVVMTARRVD